MTPVRWPSPAFVDLMRGLEDAKRLSILRTVSGLTSLPGVAFDQAPETKA